VRVLTITHQRDAGPGVFGEALAEREVEVDEWLIAEKDRPPADPFAYDAVLSFGASAHPDQEQAHPWMRPEKELLTELHQRGIPLLGVCLGSQLVASALGGFPRRTTEPEIGWYEVEVTPAGEDDPLVGPLAPSFTAFEWHSYTVDLPPGAVILARTPMCVQAYRVGDTAWGIQFHAEVSEADLAAWIGDYQVDPDAVAMGFEPAVMHAETAPRIAAWNELGRELCGRFVDTVGDRATRRARA
jgi:GMP synthase (glutamine-hydrolysing)